jgi:probable rRNA maturation factor
LKIIKALRQMIEIQQDKKGKYKIDHELIIRAVEQVLKLHKKVDHDITIRLTGDEEVKDLNQIYRKINKTTDVLSFNQDIENPETGRFYLGDIIISLEQTEKQAKEQRISFEKEYVLLAVHGTLHLLGMDHHKDIEKKKMWEIQEKILDEVFQNFQENDDEK